MTEHVTHLHKVDFKKIVQLHLDQGMAKMAFCRKAKISHKTYDRLGDGNRIQDQVIIKMAKTLKVKPSEIVYWEHQPEIVDMEPRRE